MEKLRVVDKLKIQVSTALVVFGLLSLFNHATPVTAPATGIGTSTSDAAFRDKVLTKYGVKPSAQQLIAASPFTNKHLSENRGGGLTFPDRWEVYSNQEEALLHEATHVWAKHVMNESFCAAFESALKMAADDDKPKGYFKELYYGNQGDFKGLKGNCTEQIASVSSFSMGKKDKLPKELQPFYVNLYQWSDNN